MSAPSLRNWITGNCTAPILRKEENRRPNPGFSLKYWCTAICAASIRPASWRKPAENACREACCKAKDDSPKELRIQTDLLRFSGRSQRNIETERGITLRVNRSIQVEGAFGVLKIQTFPYLRPG